MNHRLLLAGALCLAQNASAQLELVPHTADDPFIGQGQISVFADFETFHQYFIGNVQGLYPNEFTAVGHFPDGDSWTRATLSSNGSHDSDYAEWNGVYLELKVA